MIELDGHCSRTRASSCMSQLRDGSEGWGFVCDYHQITDPRFINNAKLNWITGFRAFARYGVCY